jgi:hypothetical protein
MNRQSDQHDALAAVVLTVGRDAARRVCGLAASGIELSLLHPDGPAPAPERALDAEARSEGSCGMRRFAALTVAVLAGLAGLTLLHPAQARAAGGCSVASAPTIASGATQTSNPSACPDGRQYWAMNLKIGDTLNVDVLPSGGRLMDFDVYGPNVGTIGHALCGVNANSAPFRVSCLIPAAGRYVLVAQGTNGSFTPSDKGVPAQTGRVAGSCDPASAPPAPSDVTEYANGELCQPSSRREYWSIDARAGDTLKTNVLPFGGFLLDFDVYGPNARTLGKPLCGTNANSFPFEVDCPIRRSGRYLLVTNANSGSFTPRLIHPTRTSVTAPAFVKGGGAVPIRVAIRSNTASPLGTCIVQERSGSRWAAVARVRPKSGVCHARVPANRPGTIQLRVRFKGAKGWASSTSKPIRVVVR